MEIHPDVHPSTQAGRRSGRAPVEAADLDRSRRPGVPAERPPEPWPNSRWPVERMRARPAVPTHGRPGKSMPPVYGTAVPLHGASGVIRRIAYRYPDHVATHWLLLLLGDRVDAWGSRAWRTLRIVAPLALLTATAARGVARRSRERTWRRAFGASYCR